VTDLRIGTAGWALPREVRDQFPSAASNLARYSARLNATEVNSSFYRPHRRGTYARWAASVPGDFRFAVKLPKAITHEAKLVACSAQMARFADEISGLGAKRGPVLVQLPPKLAFEPMLAATFFAALIATLGGEIVCEPRHASWFELEADALLASHRIARAAADPPPVAAAAAPGGWRGLTYLRLHGSPRAYWSRYDADALAHWTRLADAGAWIIFDNTASGAALPNALDLSTLVQPTASIAATAAS
jgi:uncharacterized protein YecE (DUF72 family)